MLLICSTNVCPLPGCAGTDLGGAGKARTEAHCGGRCTGEGSCRRRGGLGRRMSAAGLSCNDFFFRMAISETACHGIECHQSPLRGHQSPGVGVGVAPDVNF